ncbi:hypothetical protein [Arthrobacter sp. Br18]|uniref:hypothetical protein n=1 Tax=Arthrobacter sp. Br18 TaxID=1312954 RepID=UPI000479A9B4|nr:hypothetical protein [Arthrobacter sp. Br18]
MDSTGEPLGALDRMVPSGVPIETPETAVAELVDAAADAHHRIRTALKRLASTSGGAVLMFLRSGAPDTARLEAGRDKVDLDIYRIRGPV